MKNSLKRIMSVAVVAVMLVAMLVVPASADYANGDLVVGSINAYNTPTESLIWVSADETATVKSVCGYDPIWPYWQKLLLEYSADAKQFVVLAWDDVGSTAYESWTLGYGRIIVLAHEQCADVTFSSIANVLEEGNSLYLVGDYDEILATTGNTSETMYFTMNEPAGGNYWVAPVKPDLELGLNVYGDTDVTIMNADIDVVADLTDGNWVEDANAFSAAGVRLFHNIVMTDSSKHPALNLVMMYEEATAVDTIEIGFYGEYGSMVGLPQDAIKIYTSEDGEVWTEATTVNHGLALAGPTDPNDVTTGQKGTQIATLTLDEAVTAKYVKAELLFADGPFGESAGKPVWEFIGLTEVEFSYVGNDDDDDSSIVEDDSSVTEDDSSSVPAGDASASMVVFAILALVAVAGAAVVIKNRK